MLDQATLDAEIKTLREIKVKDEAIYLLTHLDEDIRLLEEALKKLKESKKTVYELAAHGNLEELTKIHIEPRRCITTSINTVGGKFTIPIKF